MKLPFACVDAAVENEAPQVAVCGDIVEAVIVDSDVGQVAVHIGDDVLPGNLEEGGLRGQIKTEQRIAVLKSLGPLRPTARRVLAVDGKDGGPIGALPAPLKTLSFIYGQGQSTIDRWNQVLWG